MVKHLCGLLLIMVMWIVLMSSLSTEPIQATKGDAFNIPTVSNITNSMSFCHSHEDGSPLDIAKKHGPEIIVSMMTEALTCELKYIIS